MLIATIMICCSAYLAVALNFVRAAQFIAALIADSKESVAEVQDEITPRVTTAIFLSATICTLGSVGTAVWMHGWLFGAGSVPALFLAVLFFRRIVPQPDSQLFQRSIVRSMQRRCAYLAANGDINRANAMAEWLQRSGYSVGSDSAFQFDARKNKSVGVSPLWPVSLVGVSLGLLGLWVPSSRTVLLSLLAALIAGTMISDFRHNAPLQSILMKLLFLAFTIGAIFLPALAVVIFFTTISFTVMIFLMDFAFPEATESQKRLGAIVTFTLPLLGTATWYIDAILRALGIR